MAYVGTLAAGTVNATSTTGVLTVARAVPAGHTIVIGCAWESAAQAVPHIESVVDTRGNTYTVTPDASINAGATVSVALLRGRVSTPLQSGDTITITVSPGDARSRWAMVAEEHSGVADIPLDVISVNTGSGATMSTGVSPPTSQPDSLVVAVFGFGQGRSVTPPADWVASPLVESSGPSANRAVVMLHRYVTVAGAYEATATVSPSSTYAAALAAYRLADTPSPAPTVAGAGWGWVPVGVP